MLRVSKRPIPANRQHFRQLSSNVQVDFTALVTANQQLAPNGCSRVDDLFFRAAVGITFLLSFWGFVLCNVCSFEGWSHLKTLHCCLRNCTARFWQMTLHGYNFITTDAQNIKKKTLIQFPTISQAGDFTVWDAPALLTWNRCLEVLLCKELLQSVRL